MNRIFGFDIARAFSMFYVVALLHLSSYCENFALTSISEIFTTLIWSTLSVFTFLSAYLLGSKYQFSCWENVLVFYKKRLIRFYPLFLISSAFLVLIGFNGLTCSIKGVLGIAPYWGPAQLTLWYIAMLMSLYLLTPLLAGKSKVAQISISILILSVIAGLNILGLPVDERTYYYFIVFFAGLFLSTHFKQLTNKILQNKWTCLLSGGLYLALLVYVHYTEHRLAMMLTGYIGAFFILNLSLLTEPFVLSNKLMKTIVSVISYASMCAYLFHQEVYTLSLRLWHPTNGATTFAYLFLICLPIVLFCSYVIQRGYDALISKYILKNKS